MEVEIVAELGELTKHAAAVLTQLIPRDTTLNNYRMPFFLVHVTHSLR